MYELLIDNKTEEEVAGFNKTLMTPPAPPRTVVRPAEVRDTVERTPKRRSETPTAAQRREALPPPPGAEGLMAAFQLPVAGREGQRQPGAPRKGRRLA